MAYKKGSDRRQRVLFPNCIDEHVEADAPVILFDAFVDRLKMDELGFIRSTPAETGTPGYNPRDLLKAVLATPAEHVYILPNNKNIIMAAEQVDPLTDRDDADAVAPEAFGKLEGVVGGFRAHF